MQMCRLENLVTDGDEHSGSDPGAESPGKMVWGKTEKFGLELWGDIM